MKEKKEKEKEKYSKIWWRKKPNGEVVLTPFGKFELLLSLVSLQISDAYDNEFLKLLKFIHYNYNVPLKDSLTYGINTDDEASAFSIMLTNRRYLELFFDMVLSQSGADQFGKFRPNVLPSKLLDYFLSDKYQEEAEISNLPNTLKDINSFIRKKLAYHDKEYFEKINLYTSSSNENPKVLKKIKKEV